VNVNLRLAASLTHLAKVAFVSPYRCKARHVNNRMKEEMMSLQPNAMTYIVPCFCLWSNHRSQVLVDHASATVRFLVSAANRTVFEASSSRYTCTNTSCRLPRLGSPTCLRHTDLAELWQHKLPRSM
jgi:hypothetical protein